MSEQLHNIDKPSGKYSDLELDEFMVFCILDTACPYEMVCRAFDALRESGMTTRKGILHWREDMIEITLKKAKYRFPKQHAKRIKDFGYNYIDLKTATRKELVDNINGIGMKLASMFLRNTRGHQYAVIDVHTDRWLEIQLHAFDQWKPKMTYEEKEKAFIGFADMLGKTPEELDLEIWQKMRIGNRKKK